MSAVCCWHFQATEMANTAEELVVCSLQNLYCVLQIPYLLEEMHRVMILYNRDVIQNPVQYGLNISYVYFKSIIHIIFTIFKESLTS